MAQRRSLPAAMMVVPVVVALFGLALLPACAKADKCKINDGDTKVPPGFSSTLKGTYTLNVEMTDLTKNETYYVAEVHERRLYHDTMTDTVGVTVWRNGTSWTYQYYPQLDVMVQEYKGECAEMGEQPKFAWGWVDKDPDHGAKSFGPSSILRLIAFLNTEYMPTSQTEEGVDVDVWKACAAEGDVELRYYYSKPPWMNPDGSFSDEHVDTLPVKMEVMFVDGFEHWIYTTVDFVPFLLSHENLEPPRGMSCEGISGVLTDNPVPSIPKHFRLAEEVILNSFIDGRDFGTQHMDKFQVTYAGEISLVSMLATLPYDNMFSTAYAVKVIHDFNTGVQYVIFKEFGNCSKDPIPPFTFDSHFGGFLGSGDTLLSPNGLFHLDDKFAFVGERESRDVLGDLWTSTRLDDIPDPVTGGMQNYEKAVLEYYFSLGVEMNPSGGFTTTNLPFRGDIFIYNSSNKEQIVGSATTNFYDFRELNLLSPDEFSVEECYEKYDDKWSYLEIFFPITQNNQIVAANEEQTRFKHEVMAKLIQVGRLSPVRIASVDVATGVSGLLPNTTDTDMIVAKIKLLERAPYLFSYRQPPDEMDPKPGKNEKLMPNIITNEDCAVVCSTGTELDCKSFHHCGDKCYLSKLTGPDGDLLDVKYCKHWVYDLENRTVEDYPTETVYKAVFEAVKTGEFHFKVPFRNNTVGVGYEAKMTLHYRTPDPLDPIRIQFTLEDTMKTVAHPTDTLKAKELIECMLLCVGWVRYRCETIIHQPDDDLCLLLDVHYHDLNETEKVPHSNSFVHGRSYLVDYNPILGGVALNTTGPSYYPVEHLETCAKYCSTETSIDCQSFEYCPSNQMCHLHAEHFLDVVDSGNYITGTACIHFSSKTDSIFTRYEDQGLDPSKHQLAAHMSSPAACARMCLGDTKEVCQSYDFCSVCDKNNLGVCGEENKNRIGLCFLSTHHLGEPDLALTTGKGCDHYDRDMFGNQDYPSWISSQRQSSKPYTPGAMTGLAFGMIFLGVLLSVGFLVAITSFKPTAVPKDFELSFQKLKSSGESSI